MNKTIPVVIMVTGHPATGKTTVAHFLAQELQLPLIWKVRGCRISEQEVKGLKREPRN